VEYSPTVRGRRLIREIERLRHGSGLSMEAAAQRLGWSTSKLYRLENGRSRITTDDLADMLDLYGVRALDGRPRSLGTEADRRRQCDHDHRHHNAARSAMLQRPQGRHTLPGRRHATPRAG
jgi:transcriptional regulator with XRE-family HTH domain